MRLLLLSLCLLLSNACRPADGETLIEGTGGACSADAECRAQADYCTSCDCRALAKNQTLPKCPGPGVRCFADPCQGKSAACRDGACTIVDNAK